MEEVVLEEPLDVFAAVDCSPVRPGAVDEVEEGEVGDSVMVYVLSAGVALVSCLFMSFLFSFSCFFFFLLFSHLSLSSPFNLFLSYFFCE